VNGGSDLPNRVHFLVNGVRRHIPALKEIAVEPPEITIDLLTFLDFLDAVDGSGLAVAKELCRVAPLDLHHFTDEIIA
jgi:hypothetical protein